MLEFSSRYTVLIAILLLGGCYLLFVEESLLNWSKETLAAPLSQGRDKRDKAAAAMDFQRFPVITICPTTTDVEGQIKELECSGHGPDSFRELEHLRQEVSITSIKGPTREQKYDCFTVNERQDYVSSGSLDYIRCSVTYNERVKHGQARLTNWANPEVWPHAVFQAPSASTYRWKTFLQDRTTEFLAKTSKYSPRDKELWLTDLHYGQYFLWNKTEDSDGPHAKFTLGIEQPPIPESHLGPAKGKIEYTSAWTILVCTFFMALATGLGSVPFYFTDKLSRYWEGVAQSMAVGVMIAASYSLIQESEGLNNAWLVFGILSGMVFIDKSQKFLAKYEDHMEFSGLKGMDAKKIILFLGIMTLHAVGEGCGVGVSFAGPSGFPKGLLVTLAIGLHNIPEGLATATILASKSVRPREVTLWTILTALPQPLLAVPAYMFVQVFSALFPFFAGFAAGCMIWISFAEIIPDALENISPTTLATATTTTTFGYKAMQYLLDTLLVVEE